MNTLYNAIVFEPNTYQKEVISKIDYILDADFYTKTDIVSFNHISNFRTLNWQMPRRSGKTFLLNKFADYFPNSILLTNTPAPIKRNHIRELTYHERGRTIDYIFIDEQRLDLYSLVIHRPKLIVRLYT